MPWAPPHEPSLALGILKARLIEEGISAEIFHGAPELLRWISLETYRLIADSWAINEFIFTGLLDDGFDSRQRASLETFLFETADRGVHSRYRTATQLAELIETLRESVAPDFVEDCVDRILAARPKVVGFTCLFDQIMASLSVARRLREREPAIRVIFGGYALHGPAGATVARAFPWIDAIVIGDGETAIVPLVRQLIERLFVSQERPIVWNASSADMETVPVPIYDDWFGQLESLASREQIQITTKVLPVESSRGCWWGERIHCVFCGIDDESMSYRHKSSDATLKMLRILRDRYGEHTFRFSDYIMPKSYYRELLPALAVEQPSFSLHSEVKSYHPPERIQLFATAGYREIQPGIESFSTDVLKRMDKGAKGIQNVSLLKAAYCCSVVVDYNLLYGLPGDEAFEYERLLEQIPTIYHLNPPVSRTEVIVTRFAPLQVDPARFGLDPPRHHKCYDVLFSEEFLTSSSFSLNDYAYYFERNFEYNSKLRILYAELVLQVEHWKEQHRERFVRLSYEPIDSGRLAFIDTRFSMEDKFVATELASRVYRVVDRQPTARTRAFHELETQMSIAEFDLALDELRSRRLVWSDGELLLGLAIQGEIADRHEASGWARRWPALNV